MFLEYSRTAVQLALKEHDQKQLYVARQNLFDIRNVYAILTDILHKNINKVRHAVGIAAPSSHALPRV